MSTVVITKNEEIQAGIEEALQHIDVAALTRGKILAMKPNATWASEQDTSAATQPDTLRAVLRHIKRCEPRQLIVSAGAGGGETDEILRLTGLLDVIEAEGADYYDHNRPPFERVELTSPPGEEMPLPLQHVMVNRRVLEYETLISLSQLKLHLCTTVTLALKNIGISFPAADHYGHPRQLFHEPELCGYIHSFIAAMARRFPIDLAITVGHPAMIGTGPIGGHTFETGLTLASTDPVSADVVGAGILGFRSTSVSHLWQAGRMGLGEMDTDRMQFPAIGLAQAIDLFTEAAFGGSAGS